MDQLNSSQYFLLNQLNRVGDIKKLSKPQLVDLACEVRKFLIESTEKTGGHLSSNLGVVELTLALHFILDLPKDEIVWDVSHQSYIHKILTERKNKMTTLRQAGGLSGFSKIKESQYDSFGAGHASTSISASLGIALAKKMNNDSGLTVAVIGDGAMTGGMAFEALNNACNHSDLNVLIILNDNQMSISKNVGGITNTLENLIKSQPYQHLRETSKQILKTASLDLLNFVKKSENQIKEILSGSNIFEQLNIDYYGPIDGHNIDELIEKIHKLKNKRGVKILHIQTQKGKGIAKAEANPLKYHGIKPKKINPKPEQNNPNKMTYSEIFGKWLIHNAKKYPKLIGVTPAMSAGSGMQEFEELFPKQFFDVGIAEQHSLTFCAGFAAKGEKPVLAIYSTFLQRAYDQLIHDASIQELDLTLAIDRAGVVGEDGATHTGQFDLSFLRILPKIVLMTPSSEIEMVLMLQTGYEHKGLAAIRYPKGFSNETLTNEQIEGQIASNQRIEIGKANIICHSKKNQLALLVFGDLLFNAKKLAQEMDLTLVDMRFVKPLDENLILSLAKSHKLLATLEENTISGGAGSFVSEFLINQNIFIPIKHIGISDEYVNQGERKKLLQDLGLDSEGIKKTLLEFINKNANTQ